MSQQPVTMECRSCGQEFSYKKRSPHCEDCRRAIDAMMKRHRREIESILNRRADHYEFEEKNSKGEPDGYQEPVFSEEQAKVLDKMWQHDNLIENMMADSDRHGNGSGWIEAKPEDDEEPLMIDSRGRTLLYSSDTGLIQDDIAVKTPRLPGGVPLGCSTTSEELQAWLLRRLKEVTADPWFKEFPFWQFDGIEDMKEAHRERVQRARKPLPPALDHTKVSESAKAGLEARARRNGTA